MVLLRKSFKLDLKLESVKTQSGYEGKVSGKMQESYKEIRSTNYVKWLFARKQLFKMRWNTCTNLVRKS